MFKIINKKNLSPYCPSFESFDTNINNDLRLLRLIIASLVNLVGYLQRLEQTIVMLYLSMEQ